MAKLVSKISLFPIVLLASLTFSYYDVTISMWTVVMPDVLFYN